MANYVTPCRLAFYPIWLVGKKIKGRTDQNKGHACNWLLIAAIIQSRDSMWYLTAKHFCNAREKRWYVMKNIGEQILGFLYLRVYNYIKLYLYQLLKYYYQTNIRFHLYKSYGYIYIPNFTYIKFSIIIFLWNFIQSGRKWLHQVELVHKFT